MWPGRLVQIECDTLEQVAEAARAGADAVLLDNMDPATVVEAIAVARMRRAGPDPDRGLRQDHAGTVGAYAAAGPDRISVGALTHSATVLDLGLDLIWTRRPTAHVPRGADRAAGHRCREHRDGGRPVLARPKPTVPVPEESVGVGIGPEPDPTSPRARAPLAAVDRFARTPDEHACC